MFGLFKNKSESVNKDGNMSRKKFLKLGATAGAAIVASGPLELFAQNSEILSMTFFKATDQKFENGGCVYELEDKDHKRIGEFWPIHGIKLVTKQLHPEVFTANLADMHETFLALGTAPDGMTTGPFGARIMEGKSLADGEPCGDGVVKQYGIVIVDGKNITFTHANEHVSDFDNIYNDVKNKKGTLFFLPSLFRNGAYISSQNPVDKVLVRRDTPDGEQIGVILFDKLVTYDDARRAILGLNRQDKNGGVISQTTHIYMLDGGGTWGQSSKKVNGEVKVIGTRNLEDVTNYLIFN